MGQLEVTWEIEDESLHLGLKGKLNTLEAMNLDERLSQIPEDVKNIYFDFDGLIYIASAGLRILYWAGEYTAERGGEVSVKNVCPEVLELLEMTGFSEYLAEGSAAV